METYLLVLYILYISIFIGFGVFVIAMCILAAKDPMLRIRSKKNGKEK